MKFSHYTQSTLLNISETWKTSQNGAMYVEPSAYQDRDLLFYTCLYQRRRFSDLQSSWHILSIIFKKKET
jgi:hypothetical protein